ncbi:hypothetical protein M0534_11250 [Methylonatrum kenyense]|uniref:hypothetical protein n=1 Tax=Methylonatrum kenyense TaxID=455253 RepID=UPI0020BDE22B|nr:hypothetical protein [Methylonatrum kenyense]MCK8516895.1 hypothetical protein [Methylonatrum kenyense]
MGNAQLRQRARALRLSIRDDMQTLRRHRHWWGRRILRQALTPAGLARAFLAGFLFQQFRPLVTRLLGSVLALAPFAKKTLSRWGLLRKALG